jgi:AcrR family transcriptional regulator
MVNVNNLVSAVNLTLVDTTGKRASGQHHGDLRRALEEAAMALVGEKGLAGFTLAEVSRRAGVSVAAPYKHFADRDALLATLVLRSFVQQRKRYRAAMARAKDPIEKLAAFASAYVRFAVEQRPLFELTFAAGLDKRTRPDLAEAGAALLGLLEAPAKAIRGDDRAAHELVLAVAACAHGHAVFVLEGVRDDQRDPLRQARGQAAEAARILAAA